MGKVKALLEEKIEELCFLYLTSKIEEPDLRE